jgi:hypothetical protein
MAKVILIEPKGTQGYASGEAACPNVGIAYLASSLKRYGHEVEVIDQNNSDQ